jgi:hypothetical protein
MAGGQTYGQPSGKSLTMTPAPQASPTSQMLNAEIQTVSRGGARRRAICVWIGAAGVAVLSAVGF